MLRRATTSESAETAKSAAWSAISWDTPSVQRIHPSTVFADEHVRRGEASGFGIATRTAANPTDVDAGVRRHLHRWCALLSRPTFGQVHGGSPMETMRIAGASVSEAADALARSGDIDWGRGRSAGRLDLGPFRSHPSELGRPWVADAVVRGHHVRRLRVTVSIFRFGNERCGIQVRPKSRRPRTTRRLRQCLRSTHGAADRLRELVLTIDFTPPRSTGGIAFPT